MPTEKGPLQFIPNTDVLVPNVVRIESKLLAQNNWLAANTEIHVHKVVHTKKKYRYTCTKLSSYKNTYKFDPNSKYV